MAEGQSWREGVVVPYASWAAGAARVAVAMRDVRAEVRFDRTYRSLMAPTAARREEGHRVARGRS
jgi:hypothetical protein